MQDTFLCDNAGNRVPPGVVSGHPVLGSGQRLPGGAGGRTVTVKPGTAYQLMALNSVGRNFSFGLEDPVAAVDLLWLMPRSTMRVVVIPPGHTLLHYRGSGAGAAVYLVELES